MTARSISRISPDTMALRALAHPQRMRMLGLLRLDGPATATSLAARMGLNSGATSYHLRQLSRHGFVEEDTERGNGRERWWRASHESTFTKNVTEDEDALDAAAAFGQAALQWQVSQMQQAVERFTQLSPAWREASTASDFTIPLTAEAAKALTEKLVELLWEAKRSAPPLGEPLPSDMEKVTFVLHAFPSVPDGEP
ncbi:ArsR/SmtB family transcription factor [Devosia rhizoryzae]|uniref:Helix-turn-helix transcriptional regulator n=1 Tax=Devosia rhizoryzae TaxID=2774137 RepID=A0ABX7C8H3_9HYPH|nr:helix-turn-helix domain-containing protein [Devosia rhizoryzae]QQR40501.1 helix-turn-helix transcriptional regulator [Devosia rhizoryzae]